MSIFTRRADVRGTASPSPAAAPDPAAPPEVSEAPEAPDLAGRRVHFVGIGGCGMSGLARIAREAGAICTGSDIAATDTVQALRHDGFDVALEQSSASVPPEIDELVISAAIWPDHPEVVEARRRGVTVTKYARMLGRLMLGRTGIAIAGTHGKSTTTSLLSHVLIETGCDPSFIVGANCRQIGGGSRVGHSDLLVAEACEYDRSFHNFHPTHGVILNVEEDHMEIYQSLDAIVEAFTTFARLLPEHGSLLIHHEMPQRLALTAGLDCEVRTLGFAPQADYRVEVDASGNRQDRPAVRLYQRGELVAQWGSPMPGEHMAYNAAAAAVLAHQVGASWNAIARAIATFQGLDRRMQRLGERPACLGGRLAATRRGALGACKDVSSTAGQAGRGTPATPASGLPVTVVDDYGHHPTEVDTTLRALRRHYRPRRLICVFQPHQHSRTRFLMEQFAASFSEADVVIVPHIYFVRDSEQERQAVSAADLVEHLRRRGQEAMHLDPFEVIVDKLDELAQPGDLVVTMGAGDVWKIARAFLESEGRA